MSDRNSSGEMVYLLSRACSLSTWWYITIGSSIPSGSAGAFADTARTPRTAIPPNATASARASGRIALLIAFIASLPKAFSSAYLCPARLSV